MIEKNYQKAYEKHLGNAMLYSKNDDYLYEDAAMTKKFTDFETATQLLVDGKLVIVCVDPEEPTANPTYHKPSTFVVDAATKQISMNGLTQTVTVKFA